MCRANGISVTTPGILVTRETDRPNPIDVQRAAGSWQKANVLRKHSRSH